MMPYQVMVIAPVKVIYAILHGGGGWGEGSLGDGEGGGACICKPSTS